MEDIDTIEYPQSRDQLTLLLMRYNALQKQGVDPRFNAEMFHLTHVLSTLSNQQRTYEDRLKSLQAKRKPQQCSIDDQIVAFQLLTRKLDLPAPLQAALVDAAKIATRKPQAAPRGWKGRLEDAGAYERSHPLAEQVIRNRVTHRLGELERLPSHLGTLDVAHGGYNSPDKLTPENDVLKIAALVEMKGLRLLSKQRSMRQHIAYHISMAARPDDLEVSALNRMFHRRVRPSSIQDMQLTEQLERQQHYEREQRERTAKLKLLESTLSHAKTQIECNNAQRAKKSQFMKGILAQHSYIEREHAKIAEKTAKQRLAALRSNDEEAYLKLLDQTKDTRITHLLKQTNSFLRNLSQAVRTQQRETGFEEAEEEQDIEKIDYYEVAHRVKENIAIQPKILEGGQLKEYQLKGLQWMVSLINNNLNGILADEMGLGKTIQTISLITYLIEVKKWSGPFLIIVPLSTITNWNVELDKWAPSVKKVVYKGQPNARKALQSIIRSGDFQVCLTTYEYIIKDRALLSKIKWEHMIIDEGHRMKNTQSKLSMTIANFYYSRFRLILTGTPLQNNLPELWALLNFVLPKIFNSVKTFDEWFNTPFANTGTSDKMELTEEETLLIIRRLHKVLRPFLLRRLKKDVEKDLPDKVEKVVKCKMSALQAKLYEHMIKHNMLYVGAKSDNKSAPAGLKGLNNKIMQLRKICNHPFVFEEVESLINPTRVTDNQIWRTAGKFELLDRILPKYRATGHRTLMFFQMTQVMSIMEDYLLFRQIPYLRLDGATKAEERSEMLKKFNAPDSPYFCFLLSTRAGGLGLNLQTADTVIIYDTDWNPFQDLQAQDRAHRIGQTKEVRILRLITEESVEEAILNRAHMKLEIDGKVIQAGKFDNKSTSEEQEAFLRSLLESGDQQHEVNADQDDFDDEELNEILARNEEEAEIFAKMDAERNAQNQKLGITRLFSDEELPEIYKRDISEHLAEKQNVVLSHRRQRATVRYNESGITDEQWVEQQLAEDEEGGLRSSRRRSKRASPAAVDVSEAKKARVDGLNKKARAALQKKLTSVLESVFEASVDESPPRQRAAIFLELPSKKHYADYYKIIKSPISLKEIQQKVSDHAYQSMDELKADFELMFTNARTYNDAESFVVKDAEALEEIIADL